MVCSILKFGTGHNFRKKTIVFCQIQTKNRLVHHLNELIVSFQTGPTELKLWPFKDALFNAGCIITRGAPRGIVGLSVCL